MSPGRHENPTPLEAAWCTQFTDGCSNTIVDPTSYKSSSYTYEHSSYGTSSSYQDYIYGIKENEVKPDTKVPVDNIILVLDNDIKSVEAVENVEAEISKKTNRIDVTIISFRFLGN